MVVSIDSDDLCLCPISYVFTSWLNKIQKARHDACPVRRTAAEVCETSIVIKITTTLVIDY